MSKKVEVIKCSPHCIYFPQLPNEIEDEYFSEGIRHRRTVRRCGYDGHTISDWRECNYYSEGRRDEVWDSTTELNYEM